MSVPPTPPFLHGPHSPSILHNASTPIPVFPASQYTNTARILDLEDAERNVYELAQIIPQLLANVKNMSEDSGEVIPPLVQKYMHLIEAIRTTLHIHTINPVTATAVPTNISAQGEVMKALLSAAMIGNVRLQVKNMLKNLECSQNEFDDENM